MNNPCVRDCPNRCPACHDHCDKYQAFRLERIKMNSWLAKENYNLMGRGCFPSSMSVKYAREKATRKGNTILRLR